MKTLFMIIWLFPIIFMVHDFEEIIMINAWKKRNKEKIEKLKDEIPLNFDASTEAFSAAVLVEFLVISLLTLFSYLTENYIAWYGLFIAFTIHLVIHFIQWFFFKKYIPALLTSIVFLPISCYMIYKIHTFVQFRTIPLFISIFISTFFMIICVFGLHKLMKKFDYWLEKFSI